MKRLFLLITIMFFCIFLSAQVTFPSEYQAEEGYQNSLQVNVNKDSRLDKLISWHIQNNKRREGIEGYRVEIFFSTNDQQRALDKKDEFLEKYPDYDVYVLFMSPNFRVRVGDFRTKNEAFKLFKEIEKDYNAAFVVTDNINFPLTKPLSYEWTNW